MANPICKRVRALRLQHNMTQAELAQQSGIPRASIANIESEKGNPSFAFVMKVADVLGVTLDDLIDEEKPSLVTRVNRESMRTHRQDAGKFAITLLSPINAPYTHVNRIFLMPGCHAKGKPHPKGSHEFFYTVEGLAVLEIQGEVIEVPAGDLIYFPGNLPHFYTNPNSHPVTAISVVSSTPSKPAKISSV